MAEDRNNGLSDAQQMLLWLLGILGAALLFALLKPDLLRLWRAAAVWHARILGELDDTALGHAFYSTVGVRGDQLAKLGRALASRDPAGFSGDLVWRVSEYIGKVVRWFLAPILILLCWDVLSYPKRFRQHFANGAALFRYVQRNFGRYLRRVENALKSDLYTGPHAVAKTTWRWATENGCLKADDSLDEARALAVLRSQLGPPFTRWDALLHGRNGWIAREVLSHLSSPEDQAGVIAYAIRGHRYESTVILALLLAARRFGVVPCMAFAGLRRVNRALWYAIESAGRRLPFIEAAGILAQYEYEMALLSVGQGRQTPQEGRVESAIAGVKVALQSELKELPPGAVAQGTQLGVWADYDPSK